MDKTLELLRETRVQASEDAQSILAKVDEEKRQISDEEQEQLTAYLDEFERISKEIETREKVEAQRTQLEQPQPRMVGPEPVVKRTVVRDDDDLDADPLTREVGKVPGRPIADIDRHRWGWRSFGEFASGVKKAVDRGGSVDRRLEVRAAPTTVGAEGVGADGGFAVPPDFRAAIMSVVEAEDSLLSRCDRLTTSSNSLTVPADQTTPWGTTGPQAYWVGENALLTQSKPSLEERTLKLNKLAVLVPVTDELLGDAPAMTSYLNNKVPAAIDFKINLAIVQGSGVAQPLGILNSDALVSITKETSQLADTIVGANAIKMWARMYGRARGNGVWLINQDIEPSLLRLTIPGIDNTGAVDTGWGTMVYMPPNGLSQSPYGTLFGRPVIPTEACETLGDKGDIFFVNLSHYLVAMKTSGVRAETSIHLWFDYDTTAFRFIMRIAGMPWWSTTISPRDGSNTLSPFVTLAERA